MAQSPPLDPLEMWRQALTRFEGGFNTMAHNATDSNEVTQALHQFSGMSRSLQQVFEKASSSYYKRLNLSSRQDIAAMAETLERIEAKLDQLLTAQVPPVQASRPARTRRPPAADTAPAAALSEVPAEVAVQKPAVRRTRKKA